MELHNGPDIFQEKMIESFNGLECVRAYIDNLFIISNCISRETLLVYPKFIKPFVIHTDDSKIQLGTVINQENKPIAFYSRKLNLRRLITQQRK